MGRKDIHIDGQKTQFKSENHPRNGGRPKGIPNTASRLQRFLNAVKEGKNPVSGEHEEFTVAEMMDLQQIAKALNGDTAAWEKLNDRLEGKPKQSTELTGKDGADLTALLPSIQISFRPPTDDEPSESQPKGEKKRG